MAEHTISPIEELHARVYSYVQGVGFRYFIVHEAQSLALSGYTRNEYDSSTAVLAQGSRLALERLLTLLHLGPSVASVRDVRATWSIPGEPVRAIASSFWN